MILYSERTNGYKRNNRQASILLVLLNLLAVGFEFWVAYI